MNLRPAPPSPAAPRTPRWTAFLCLAASMTLVGSYVGLSKLLVAAFPVFLLAWLRFGIAAAAMATWLRRSPGEPPLARRDFVLLFWEAFVGNFLFSIFMLYGMRLGSALAAGVVMAALPAVVALLSWVFLGERPGARVLAAVACAVAGIALVAAARHEGGGGAAPLGVALLVGAVVCEAAYVVIGKRLTAAVGARRISAIVNLWGLALVTPFGAWQASSFDFGAIGAPLWALLLYYALAASVVAVWLWMTGLRHVPAAHAGIFTVLLPVAAAFVGVQWLGESFGAMQAGAFALALAGIVLVTTPARRRAR